MKLKQALTFLEQNQNFNFLEKSIIGIYHDKDNLTQDGKFQIFDIRSNFLDPEISNFSIGFSAGDIAEFSGSEDNFLGDSINEILEQAPPIIDEINFKIYPIEFISGMLMTEFCLYELFPELPNPEYLNLDEMQNFTEQAVKLINQANNG